MREIERPKSKGICSEKSLTEVRVSYEWIAAPQSHEKGASEANLSIVPTPPLDYLTARHDGSLKHRYLTGRHDG